MRLLGLDLGPNRTPFQNMTAAEFEKMSQETQCHSFLGFCYQTLLKKPAQKGGDQQLRSPDSNVCIK